MTSMREQVIARLYTKLKTLETAQVKVYRNLDKPQKITSGGILILRDGTADDPEVFLSPVTYIFEHVVTLEVKQTKDGKTIMVTIENILTGQPFSPSFFEARSTDSAPLFTLGEKASDVKAKNGKQKTGSTRIQKISKRSTKSH